MRSLRRENPHGISRSMAAAFAALLFTVALSGIARANELGFYTADGVNIRTGPHVTDTSLGLGYSSQQMCEYFTVSGDTINSNPYWAYHENLSTTVTGYSSWEYLGIYGPPPTAC